MPRTLRQVKPDFKEINFTPNTIDTFESQHQLKIGAKAMQLIEAWSKVDLMMARVFVLLFGGPDTMATNIYLALGARSPKLRAVHVAAQSAADEGRISYDEFKVFHAVRSLYAKGGKERDDFAHGQFNYLPELPEELIYIPSPDAIRGIVDPDRAIVYNISELHEIIRGYWRLGHRINELHAAIDEKNQKTRAELFAALTAQPEIARELLKPRNAPTFE